MHNLIHMEDLQKWTTSAVMLLHRLPWAGSVSAVVFGPAAVPGLGRRGGGPGFSFLFGLVGAVCVGAGVLLVPDFGAQP